MATGGNFKRSIDKGCDVVYDYTCTRCDSSNEATHYCPSCDIYYCKLCLQFLCQHGVLGRNEVGHWGKTTCSTHEEECTRHPGNKIQLYCKQHDSVCCHVCVPLYHKSCNLDFIPDIVAVTSPDTDLQRIVKDLDKLHRTIDKVKNDRTTRKTRVQKCQSDAIKTIQDYRKRINERLDALEKMSIEEVEESIKDLNAKLQADFDICNTSKTECVQFTNKLKNTHQNKTQKFITLKKCQEWYRNSDKIISDMDKSMELEKINLSYSLNLDIEESFVNENSLGKVIFSDRLYKAQNRKDYNIKMRDDTKTCSPEDICQLPNGNMVITDMGNDKLKQLDGKYMVISHCSLPATPRGVCCVGREEVVVALGNKTLQFVSVGASMVTTRSITLDHACWGLAHNRHCHQGQLYITDTCSTVYVYSMTGERVHAFSKDEAGQQMFSKTYHIDLSPDGNTIYIADLQKGLVSIDIQGNLLATFKPPELSVAVGVCVGGDGSVFVTGYGSGNVIQVGEKGDKKVADVVPSGGLVNPNGLCIDRHRSRLMVAIGDSNIVSVFDLVQDK